MVDKSNICKKYIKLLGRDVTILKKDGSEDKLLAVVQDYWKSRRSYFEKHQFEIGTVEHDYYFYIGAPDYDITQLTEDDIVSFDNKKYYFINTDAIKIGGRVQYYTGILKRIWEGDYDFE